MTRFYKYILYSITLFLILIPVVFYLDYNLYLIIFIEIDIITLLLGLSGLFDKITMKPWGEEVLGLSAILQGIIYIILSISFTYMIVGIFFYVIEGKEFLDISSSIVFLWIVLFIFDIFLPENQDIKFGITQPWIKEKHQKKIAKVIEYIDQNGYELFITNVDIDKLALIFSYFDKNIQVGIYNNLSNNSSKYFEKKVKDAKNIKLSHEEIDKILDNILVLLK